jgi:phosphopantothenoylcysteine synthetase/decarboxylase
VSQTDAGFAVDTNRVTLLTSDGRELPLPLLSKLEVAERIMVWLEQAVGTGAA